jgi:hypothetical protein
MITSAEQNYAGHAAKTNGATNRLGLRAPLIIAEPGPGIHKSMKRVAALLGRALSLPAAPPDAKLSD